MRPGPAGAVRALKVSSKSELWGLIGVGKRGGVLASMARSKVGRYRWRVQARHNERVLARFGQVVGFHELLHLVVVSFGDEMSK